MASSRSTDPGPGQLGFGWRLSSEPVKPEVTWASLTGESASIPAQPVLDVSMPAITAAPVAASDDGPLDPEWAWLLDGSGS